MPPKRLGRNPTMRVRSKIIHKKAKNAKNALEDIGFNALNTLSFDDNVKKSKENAADADSDVAIHETFTLRYEHVTLSRNNGDVRKILAVNPMLMAATTLRFGMMTYDPTPAPASL
ncbi:hypothetical protein E4U30_004159 [Claviceps sp. LM220 group G6]|nr:hypothetical protein E4U30_004159 [Claviceps sp. LM220 group G6]